MAGGNQHPHRPTKYTYTLQADGVKLTGKASVEANDQKREVELKEGRIAGDTVTFVEMLKIQDNDIRIEYKGKLATNEIKFTRQVGEFATEEFVAKRIQAAAAPSSSAAPNATNGGPPNRGPGGFNRPIVLGPDDKPAFADPPAGFDVKREGIAHGRLEMITYDSKTVGTQRKMLVYTPPAYSTERRYPVLYLLHGIGGDETEWQRFAAPEVILDNLLADQNLVPMIVVMRNGRAQPNDRAEGDIFSHFKAIDDVRWPADERAALPQRSRGAAAHLRDRRHWRDITDGQGVHRRDTLTALTTDF